MELFNYDPKDNTLYINSALILPNTKGLSMKEHVAAYKEAFSLSYQERIRRYSNENQKVVLERAIEAHPGCTISEFSNI